MTVAAVLAQQRQAMPHHQVRGFGPVQIGVAGVERPPLGTARAGCIADQSGKGGHVSGGDDIGAKQAGQRSVGSGEPGLDDGGRAGELPRPRDAPGHQRRIEVVERRGDNHHDPRSAGGLPVPPLPPCPGHFAPLPDRAHVRILPTRGPPHHPAPCRLRRRQASRVPPRRHLSSGTDPPAPASPRRRQRGRAPATEPPGAGSRPARLRRLPDRGRSRRAYRWPLAINCSRGLATGWRVHEARN